MRKLTFLIIIFAILSCNNTAKNKKAVNIKEPKIQKTNEIVNENLLYFDLALVTDVDVYDKNESKLYEINKLKVNYVDDIIYVIGFINTNACDYFKGNIEIKNDNLKLIMTKIPDEPCMSCSKFEVRFIIKNEKKKKYKINYEIK